MTGSKLVQASDSVNSEAQCDLPVSSRIQDAISTFAKTTSSFGPFEPMLKDAVKQAKKWRDTEKSNSDFFLDEVFPLIYGLIIEVSRDQGARASLESECKNQGIHFVTKTSVATMVVRLCLGVEREMGNRIAACCLELAMRGIAIKHASEAVRSAGGVKPLAQRYRMRVRANDEKKSALPKPKIHWEADHRSILEASADDGEMIYAVLRPIGLNRFIVVKLASYVEGRSA